MGARVAAVQDRLLTNVSSKIVPMGYISEAVFPSLQFAQNSGKIASYGNQHLRVVNSVLSGSAPARRVTTGTESTSSFYIEDHGLSDVVSKSDYRNYQEPFDAEADKVEDLVHAMWLGKEKALADALADTAILTQNVTLSGASQFSDYANSDPLGQFTTARKTVRDGCGLPANAAAMDWEVAEKLRYHPSLLDALGFKEQRPGGLADAELMKALNVEYLFIAKAVYNSAHEGQSDVIAPVWGKHVVMYNRPSAAAKKQKSLGYHLTLQGEMPRKVYKSPISNPPGSTELVCTDSYDQLIANVGAGYLIKNAIA